jgi:hypothetical protein
MKPSWSYRFLSLSLILLLYLLAGPSLYARATSDPLAGPDRADAACVADAMTLCLNAGRFQVQVQWATTDGRNGAGQAVALTADTGYFWFFSANNVEMVIKVVDGRAVNNNFWVFAGGLTNVYAVITVTDTQAGLVKVYANPQGTAFQPIQDTGPFSGPPAFDVTGTWSGPASDEKIASTFTFNLTQTGGSVTGTVVVHANTGPVARGTITGTMSGATLTYTIDLPNAGGPGCTVTLEGTANVSAAAISGTYTGNAVCSGPFSGGLISLAKQ